MVAHALWCTLLPAASPLWHCAGLNLLQVPCWLCMTTSHCPTSTVLKYSFNKTYCPWRVDFLYRCAQTRPLLTKTLDSCTVHQHRPAASTHCRILQYFQVTESHVSALEHRIKTCPWQQKSRPRRKQQSQPNLVFPLMSPLPAISGFPVAFPVSARFQLVLFASLVMDYLSVVSQYNDIQAAAHPAPSLLKMTPLFISSLAHLRYHYLALAFLPSTFSSPPSGFSYSTAMLRLHSILELQIYTFEIPKIIWLFSFSVPLILYSVSHGRKSKYILGLALVQAARLEI